MDNIEAFFQNNPKIFGIALIVVGVLWLVFTLLSKTNKLLRNSTNRYRVKDFAGFFGAKIGGIATKIFNCIISLALIIAGIVFVIFI
jgi:hypothetical protein